MEKHTINTGRDILTRDIYNALWALVPKKTPSDSAAASASGLGMQNPCGTLSQTGKGRAVHDTLESVERTRFHTKEEVEQRDAFAHLDMLSP